MIVQKLDQHRAHFAKWDNTHYPVPLPHRDNNAHKKIIYTKLDNYGNTTLNIPLWTISDHWQINFQVVYGYMDISIKCYQGNIYKESLFIGRKSWKKEL